MWSIVIGAAIVRGRRVSIRGRRVARLDEIPGRCHSPAPAGVMPTGLKDEAATMSLGTMIFSWSDKATFSTRLFTWRKGQRVGEDALGNRYYQERGRPEKQGPHWNRRRRWVIYKGRIDASSVPPEWNAWLQHTTDVPPTDPAADYTWEKPHEPNRTGTSAAYHPPGSIAAGGERAATTGDYEEWRPE